jgi:hypothetical protein
MTLTVKENTNTTIVFAFAGVAVNDSDNLLPGFKKVSRF